MLDFDATDNPLYGQQEGRFFHGYCNCNCYCYLPLYVFFGRQLLWAYLRAPVAPMARNTRLQLVTPFLQLPMKDEYQRSGVKRREVRDFLSAAQSWASERRVITRLEYREQRANPHDVVTNLTGHAKARCDDLYCQRNEAQNRIKEAQVGLFATRTSCHHLQSNPLRVPLAALRYVLIERLGALALQDTACAFTPTRPAAQAGAGAIASAAARLRRCARPMRRKRLIEARAMPNSRQSGHTVVVA